MPLVANYYLTFSCNASCEFCFVWQNKDLPKENTPLLNIKKNLLDLKQIDVKFINFTGGEPLLYENIIDVLKFARGLNFKISLSTNCSFYPEKAKNLRGLIDNFYFSLDAPFAELHNQIRGIENFGQVIKSIEIAKKLGEKIILISTLTRNNIVYLPDLADFAKKNDLLIWLNPVYNCEWLGDFGVDFFYYLERYFNHRQVGINLASSRFLRDGGNNIKNSRCFAQKAVITISPDNYLILPCIYLPLEKAKIEDNLLAIFKKNKNFDSRGKKCEHCSAWEYIIPSFWYKFDKYFFLNAFSTLKWWLKKIRN